MDIPDSCFMKIDDNQPVKTVCIPFNKELKEPAVFTEKIRVMEMYKNGRLVAKWALDEHGRTMPGTQQYFNSEIKTEMESLPRMDRIMRYGI